MSRVTLVKALAASKACGASRVYRPNNDTRNLPPYYFVSVFPKLTLPLQHTHTSFPTTHNDTRCPNSPRFEPIDSSTRYFLEAGGSTRGSMHCAIDSINHHKASFVLLSIFYRYLEKANSTSPTSKNSWAVAS